MTVTAKWYSQAIGKAFAGAVDWPNGTIKCALVTSAYTPNQDTDDYFDHVAASELSVTGYVAGGEELTTRSLAYTAGSNLWDFLADDVVWTGALIVDARYAVVYQEEATPETSPLICYIDFGENRSAWAGAFSILWPGGAVTQAVVG